MQFEVKTYRHPCHNHDLILLPATYVDERHGLGNRMCDCCGILDNSIRDYSLPRDENVQRFHRASTDRDADEEELKSMAFFHCTECDFDLCMTCYTRNTTSGEKTEATMQFQVPAVEPSYEEELDAFTRFNERRENEEEQRRGAFRLSIVDDVDTGEEIGREISEEQSAVLAGQHLLANLLIQASNENRREPEDQFDEDRREFVVRRVLIPRGRQEDGGAVVRNEDSATEEEEFDEETRE